MIGFDAVATIAILLIRPGMLVVATPYLGSAGVPAVMRIGLSVLLAVLLAPVVPVPAPNGAGPLAAIVVREFTVGLAMAMALRLLVYGAEFAGHFTATSVGLSLGSLLDPHTGVRNSLFAILYANITVLTVLATNAHHEFLRALVASYAAVPIGLGGPAGPVTTQAAEMLGLIFVLGVRIAAPVVVVMLVVELALGVIGRVAPALNVLIAGAPLRLAVGLLVVGATVGTIPQIITRFVPSVLSVAADAASAFR
jgi:flagellar biosynthetic protein FliR